MKRILEMDEYNVLGLAFWQPSNNSTLQKPSSTASDSY